MGLIQLIEWDDAHYDVGHALLNQQHKTLIEMINEMATLINDGSSEIESQLPYLFQRFYRLFDAHLAREEQILVESDYPTLQSHKREHDEYLDRVSEFILDGLELSETQQELLTFLTHWWNDHILVQDMAYKSHLLQQNQ